MGRAKEIIIKVVPSKVANEFVKKHHYSGKVVPNSTIHFGAFLDDKLHGIMSYGPSINKKGTINLVQGTGWNEFIELNRMAFDNYLPKYSESRCIAISIKLIKKNAPQIKWIISFADGTQCGDGTIYRASGFKLVGIVDNTALRINPENGEAIHVIQAHHLKISNQFKKWKPFEGKQLKYIYLIDKSCKINVPILPFTKIDDLGAGMYKGKKISLAERKAQEKLQLRSLDSGPFKQNLADFFDEKKDEMEQTGKNEYVLTQDEVESYSPSDIEKSFNEPMEDEDDILLNKFNS